MKLLAVQQFDHKRQRNLTQQHVTPLDPQQDSNMNQWANYVSKRQPARRILENSQQHLASS
jgi:hypothetical protein